MNESRQSSSWGVEGEAVYGWPSKNRVFPPNWMVKIMKNPIKHGMIWGYPYFWKHPYRLRKNPRKPLVKMFFVFNEGTLVNQTKSTVTQC